MEKEAKKMKGSKSDPADWEWEDEVPADPAWMNWDNVSVVLYFLILKQCSDVVGNMVSGFVAAEIRGVFLAPCFSYPTTISCPRVPLHHHQLLTRSTT